MSNCIVQSEAQAYLQKVNCQRVRPVSCYRRRFSVSVCLSSWVHRRREKREWKVNTVNQKALQHGGRVNTVDTHTALHLILSGSDSLSSFLLPSPPHISLPHHPSLIVSTNLAEQEIQE